LLTLVVSLHISFNFVMPGLEQRKGPFSAYKFEWDYTDKSGRGGLGQLDRMFLSFLTIMSLTLVGFNLAVKSNRDYGNPNDVGTWAGVVGTSVILPIVWGYLLL